MTYEHIEQLASDLQHKDAAVRRQAVYELAEWNVPEATQYIVAALSDADPYVRIAAVRSLKLPDRRNTALRLIEMLGDENEVVREEVADAFDARLGNDVLEELLKLLHNEDVRSHQREAAVWAIENFAQADVFTHLLNALQFSDSLVKQAVIESLSHMGNAEAVKPIISALQDEDDEVRWLAAVALGRLSDKRAVEPLINALHDTSADVRSAAAHSLGSPAAKSAVQPLIEMLSDTDVKVRIAAVNALGWIGDVQAIEVLDIYFRDLIDQLQIVNRTLHKLHTTIYVTENEKQE